MWLLSPQSQQDREPGPQSQPRGPAPAGHVVRHLRPSGGPGVGHQEVSRRRRKAQETGAVSAATSSEDGGEVMGATRGGDAATTATRRSAFQAQAAHKGQRRLSERRPGPRDVTPGHRLLAQMRISPGRGRLRAPPALAGVSAPEAPVPETREGCPRAGGTQASSGTRTRASDVPQQHEEKDGCRGPAGGMRNKAAVRVCVWVCLCECTCVVCVHM